MTWEWSHTPEAYENARQQLAAMDRETKEEIYAEWATVEDTEYPYSDGDFDEGLYTLALARAKEEHELALEEEIWQQAEELRNCTNGGHQLWACPFGCSPHLLPVDPPEGTECP